MLISYFLVIKADDSPSWLFRGREFKYLNNPGTVLAWYLMHSPMCSAPSHGNSNEINQCLHKFIFSLTFPPVRPLNILIIHFYTGFVLYLRWWSVTRSVVSDSLRPCGLQLPGSSVHGILQARILEWVAIPFSRGFFLTQGLNLGLLHCRSILHRLSHQGSPWLRWYYYIYNFVHRWVHSRKYF